ncbi:MAG: hypothetical protein PHT51_02430 [Patescibacteria group bacterium]|nr:hypothetical protein [Patescibacteria group bacterium]MDD4611082.1 hypothetical protein [Patescibacteria group bacterium]
MNKKQKIVFAVLLVLLAASSRLIKHPYNFTPIAAMSIFAGAYLCRRWAVVLPLAAMLASDFFIGFYDWQVMASVYASIAVSFFVGRYLSKKIKWYSVVFGALLSSVIFFIITNFAVWIFFNWYPHTFAGLASCFTMALPFFRNTLAGDLLYSGVLFGGYEAVSLYFDRKFLVGVKVEN